MSLTDVRALTEAVIKEAERDRDRYIENATRVAGEIREDAQGRADAKRARVLASAKSQATMIKEQTLAAARLEAQEINLQSRESLLDAVFRAAASRLESATEREDYKQIVERLLADAVTHLDNVDALVVRADPVGHAILREAMQTGLGTSLGCEVSLGDLLGRGAGLLVQSEDGRVSYDNTLEARLSRQRTTLRPAVFAILIGREPTTGRSE